MLEVSFCVLEVSHMLEVSCCVLEVLRVLVVSRVLEVSRMLEVSRVLEVSFCLCFYEFPIGFRKLFQCGIFPFIYTYY